MPTVRPIHARLTVEDYLLLEKHCAEKKTAISQMIIKGLTPLLNQLRKKHGLTRPNDIGATR